MPQTTIAPNDRTIKSLPRRGAGILPRKPRPRLQAQDAFLVLLVSLPVWVTAHELHIERAMTYPHPVAVLCAMGCACTVYLLAWALAGRPAAVTAGLLLSTGVPFLQQAAAHPAPALFGLCTALALSLYLLEQQPAAMVAAACAIALRADGFLLGGILLAHCVIQRRPAAVPALVAFALCVGAACTVRALTGHSAIPYVALGLRRHPLACIGTSGAAFLLWFALPFAGDLFDRSRRERLSPLIAWAVASCLAACLCRSDANPAAALWPLLSVLVGGGIGRLLPALSAEIPAPAGRYAIAILAVMLAILLSIYGEFSGLRT